jgi:flagellar basal-body rod protein FlgB
MPTEIDRLFGLHQAALSARGRRAQVLASNIANADTPGYQARDIDFKAALGSVLGVSPAPAHVLVRTSAHHLSGNAIGGSAASPALVYRTVSQPSIDNNTVDINIERAQFADNSMRYEASLTFINAKVKAMLAALQN